MILKECNQMIIVINYCRILNWNKRDWSCMIINCLNLFNFDVNLDFWTKRTILKKTTLIRDQVCSPPKKTTLWYIFVLFQSPYNTLTFDRTGEGSATTYFNVNPSNGAVFLTASVSAVPDERFYVSLQYVFCSMCTRLEIKCKYTCAITV